MADGCPTPGFIDVAAFLPIARGTKRGHLVEVRAGRDCRYRQSARSWRFPFLAMDLMQERCVEIEV
jgi:hypothetical protein